ncbi:MAG: M14 family zinc carboxypeptidase, partial [Verrucomicrobiota bacterium]
MNGAEEHRPLPDRGRHQWQPEPYGKSVLGQELEVWMPTAVSPRFLIMAGLHGEEPETTVVLSRALRTLSCRSAHAAVILAANPDGLIRGTRGNARGVDLNRNFPCQSWQGAPITHRWVVEEPSQVQLSPGTFPRSEPEVADLVDLIDRLKPD